MLRLGVAALFRQLVHLLPRQKSLNNCSPENIDVSNILTSCTIMFKPAIGWIAGEFDVRRSQWINPNDFGNLFILLHQGAEILTYPVKYLHIC